MPEILPEYPQFLDCRLNRDALSFWNCPKFRPRFFEDDNIVYHTIITRMLLVIPRRGEAILLPAAVFPEGDGAADFTDAARVHI
jgi:hypothetical protein